VRSCAQQSCEGPEHTRRTFFFLVGFLRCAPAAASAAAAGLLMMGLGCVGASCSLAVVVDDGVGGDEEAKN